MDDFRAETALTEIHATSDYFHQEGLVEFSSRQSYVDYRKRDLLFTGGEWRGRNYGSLKSVSTSANVLLLGHSDFSTTTLDLARIRVVAPYRKVFASNFAGYTSVSRWLGGSLLPLGLSNPTRESKLHMVYGDQQAMATAFDSVLTARRRPAEGLHVYANFSVHTAPKQRQALLDYLVTLPNVHVGAPTPTPLGRRRFLEEIRAAGLVVCPQGNGLDTHRLYETLYMGAIPIVLKSSYQYRICRVFGWPVVGLRAWRDVANHALLLENARKETFSPSGLDALRLSHWCGPQSPLFR